MSLFCHVTLLSYYPSIVYLFVTSLFCNVTLLSCHSSVLSPFCHVTILSWLSYVSQFSYFLSPCHVILLSCHPCHVIPLSCHPCHVILLPLSLKCTGVPRGTDCLSLTPVCPADCLGHELPCQQGLCSQRPSSKEHSPRC